MATQSPTLEATQPLSSRRSSASGKSLKLDLSSLPPLTQPTPPSNTLLFTNLQDAAIFRPDNLQTIRDLVTQTAPIHAWAPLKSFRRIVVSFFDEDAAIAVRRIWDGEAILGNTVRVYFGTPTPIDPADRHLALPDAGKLFFISPPPSPPHGWEMRLEDAPNKMVHAEDLADALAKLRHEASRAADTGIVTPISPVDAPAGHRTTRSRSSTLLYQPEVTGTSPVADLPAICLEDMTDEPVIPAPAKPIMAHTSRPPVELMH
ncbi:Calcipressin-domain-containing protein [Plectosphaerella plurivora]|uniref:Calcipressin-domain-containing protein n=1 Tax=Plectosphaerella plurivora TaxID=936078 RepID=A0A9P8VCQ0_9PEZI|nr:Calcipressin-domain-containing protein [Plectosphaerella plurivora]